MNNMILRLEGLVVFALTVTFYYINEFSWLVFLVFLLAPDISIIGYKINNRVGAHVYNIFHTYAIPLLLVIVSFLTKQDNILMVGLIWTAHIGMDRAFGFGLKNITGFKDTHLGQF